MIGVAFFESDDKTRITLEVMENDKATLTYLKIGENSVVEGVNMKRISDIYYELDPEQMADDLVNSGKCEIQHKSTLEEFVKAESVNVCNQIMELIND